MNLELLQQQVQFLRDELSAHTIEEKERDAAMEQRFDERFAEVFRKIDELAKIVQSLLDILNQAKGIVTFIKWASGLGTVIGGAIIFIKDHIK